MLTVDTLKAAQRASRKSVARSKREQRRRERRCFWTRPFGHEWVVVIADTDTGTVERKCCIACEKPYAGR